MPRGGRREGSGRPATGRTIVAVGTRIPKALEYILNLEATRMGITISMLIRRVLEEKFLRPPGEKKD